MLNQKVRSVPEGSRFSAALFQQAPVGLVVLDAVGMVVDANSEALAILGVSPGELFGRVIGWEAPVLATDVPQAIGAQLAGLVATARRSASGGLVSLHVAAGVRTLKVRSQTLGEGDVPPLGQIVSLVDLTDDWAAAGHPPLSAPSTDARMLLDAYKSAIEQQAIVAVTDRAGRVTYVNDKFCEISQYERHELVGQTHRVVNSGHHPRSFFVEMWKTIGHGTPWHGEVCNRARDGSTYWVDTIIVPMRDAAERISGYLSIRFDITERKRADAELAGEVARRRDAETLLRDVIETVPDAIATYDEDDRLQIFNSAYREFYKSGAAVIREGVKFETILRQSVKNGQFSLPQDNPQAREAWIAARLKQHRNPGRVSLQHLADGRWLQVQERRSPSGHIVGVRTDITALKEAERRIKHQAERDPLTGLYNRSVLLDRLVRHLGRSRKAEVGFALAIMDLDNFKDINDTLGHPAGDELLVRIGERLTGALRTSDTIVRMGGDEFAVILANIRDEEGADRLLRRVHDALTATVEVAGRHFRPAASMGVCLVPRDGADPAELLKRADIALYHAKARGRGHYCFFSALLSEGIENRQATADALRGALERGELDVALQPQFSIADGSHTGFEALARWRHEGRDIPPNEFIPVAEETGLIGALGRFVLDRALGEAARLLKKGCNPGMIAVNVAASELKQEGFAAAVGAMLDAHGLPASILELEVTENVLLDRSADKIADALLALHRMDIRIALDDFGTGHASLAHLKRFPVDRLKIDRSFVRGIGHEPDDEVIVRTVVSLAHSLGKSVVAEGVETEAQLAFLREIECDIGQGYLVSRPLALAQVDAFMAAQGGLHAAGKLKAG